MSNCRTEFVVLFCSYSLKIFHCDEEGWKNAIGDLCPPLYVNNVYVVALQSKELLHISDLVYALTPEVT